jgi:hypothetical protein
VPGGPCSSNKRFQLMTEESMSGFLKRVTDVLGQ